MRSDELRKLQALRQIREENDRMLRYCSVYLNEAPCLVESQEVAALVRDCGVDEEGAFCAILGAALGLDGASNAADRAFERQYLRPAVRQLDPSVYENDAYLQTIRLPDGAGMGDWELRTQQYRPYEGFIWREAPVEPDFREIPQIGFFKKPYAFPSVLEKGVEWMAVKPNEQETMRAPLAAAHGRVVTLGLGMGYFAFHACEKDTVTSVTVLERSESVIRLFREWILPQFPHGEKLRILQGDAFALLPQVLAEGADFVFADLWHDVSDGFGLYLRLRRLEETLDVARPWAYWIERSLLAQLRPMVLDALLRRPPEHYEQAVRALQDEALRQTAARMRPVDPTQS